MYCMCVRQCCAQSNNNIKYIGIFFLPLLPYSQNNELYKYTHIQSFVLVAFLYLVCSDMSVFPFFFSRWISLLIIIPLVYSAFHVIQKISSILDEGIQNGPSSSTTSSSSSSSATCCFFLPLPFFLLFDRLFGCCCRGCPCFTFSRRMLRKT